MYCRFYRLGNSPAQSMGRVNSRFVGLLTDMSRRHASTVLLRLPSCSPVTRFRGKRSSSMLTVHPEQHHSGRVQVFHLIPLFSRTRMRVSQKWGRAFATKAGAIYVCFDRAFLSYISIAVCGLKIKVISSAVLNIFAFFVKRSLRFSVNSITQSVCHAISTSAWIKSR